MRFIHATLLRPYTNLNGEVVSRIIGTGGAAPGTEAAGRRSARERRRFPAERLEAENRRLQRKLQRAETIITLQKKVAEILGIPLKPLDGDEID